MSDIVSVSENHVHATTAVPAPDFAMAERFLRALAPECKVHCFQTFDDHGQNPHLARTLHGSLDDLGDTLKQMNAQGAGVFVTVNEVVQGKPRRVENVTKVRALFADLDDPDRRGEVEARIADLKLPPSITVETSPGRRHYYWRIAGCPLAEFPEAQRALAKLLGTDSVVCDLPRVMRVPGFVHRKGVPFVLKLLEAHE